MSKDSEAVTKEEMKEALKDAVDAILPAAVAAAQAASPQAQMRVAPPKAQYGTCAECRQPNMACGGKHRKALVYMTGAAEDSMPYWRGVGINGVWYKSAAPNQLVTVPDGVPVEAMADEWGRVEIENKIGRKKTPSAMLSGG